LNLHSSYRNSTYCSKKNIQDTICVPALHITNKVRQWCFIILLGTLVKQKNLPHQSWDLGFHFTNKETKEMILLCLANQKQHIQTYTTLIIMLCHILFWKTYINAYYLTNFHFFFKHSLSWIRSSDNLQVNLDTITHKYILLYSLLVLCRVFTIMYPKQTKFLGYTVLLLFCIYNLCYM